MARPKLDLHAAALEIRVRSRKAQGLPEVMEDPAVLDQLAELLDPGPTVPARSA